LKIFFLKFFLDRAEPAHSFWAGPDLSGPVSSGEWINSLSTVHMQREQWRRETKKTRWRRKKKMEEGRTCGAAGDSWPENGLDGGRSFFFFFYVSLFSALFFLSFPILFLLALSGHSSVSAVATVVAHSAGGDGGGLMWLQMVVPGGRFSSFLLCFCFSSISLCLCFFFCFSRGRGCYQWRGRRWHASGGSGVAVAN